MTLVPSFFTLLREKTWYIPGWLDRILPNLTVEAPHEGQGRQAQPAKPSPAPVGER